MGRSGSGSARRPKTVIGRWLVAAATGQNELRDRLAAQMPAGPVRRDELAVQEAAAERALRQYFGRGYDVRAVTAFAMWMREESSAFGLGLMEREAVLRAALGEADVDGAGIAAEGVFWVHSLAVVRVAQLLEWEEPVLAELVAKAELTALKRGWKPAPASPASRPDRTPRGRQVPPAAATAAAAKAPEQQPRRAPPAVTGPGRDEAENDGEPHGAPADPAAALRMALISGTNLAATIRQSSYHDLLFAVHVFTESVRRRFGPDCDIRDVTRFTARIKAAQPGAGYRPRDAELMIRAALGEYALVRDIDMERIGVLDIVIAVLEGLLAERPLTPAELDAYVAQAQALISGASARQHEVVEYLSELSPQLSPESLTQLIGHLLSGTRSTTPADRTSARSGK